MDWGIFGDQTRNESIKTVKFLYYITLVYDTFENPSQKIFFQVALTDL